MAATNTRAQNVVVYSNQFLTPLDTPSIATWCQLDFGVDPVNDLWAGTGSGTSSGQFENTNTVETILITGPADVYDDPSGIGGDYSIGMLNTGFGDKLGLLIDTEGLPFVNVAMDLSAINTTCGGPFPMDTAVFLLELLDAPGGIFVLSSGTVLDADTLTGTGPDADSFVFNWAHAEGSLDVSGSTDGMVALRMTLIRSSYASFDNIYIEASVDSVISSVHEDEAHALGAFPIPCADLLTLTGMRTRPRMVTIFSTMGEAMRMVPIAAQGTVDVSGLPPGAYVVRVEEGDQVRTVRFIRE
ncbi:MAG: T9SS type A sorting domain-containing protein [Flavobacteriales bacterium]|nr:T9SS type A sorting domain-containing protein [Flavobacteriales bacterium]